MRFQLVGFPFSIGLLRRFFSLLPSFHCGLFGFGLRLGGGFVFFFVQGGDFRGFLLRFQLVGFPFSIGLGLGVDVGLLRRFFSLLPSFHCGLFGFGFALIHRNHYRLGGFHEGFDDGSSGRGDHFGLNLGGGSFISDGCFRSDFK